MSPLGFFFFGHASVWVVNLFCFSGRGVGGEKDVLCRICCVLGRLLWHVEVQEFTLNDVFFFDFFFGLCSRINTNFDTLISICLSFFFSCAPFIGYSTQVIGHIIGCDLHDSIVITFSFLWILGQPTSLYR